MCKDTEDLSIYKLPSFTVVTLTELWYCVKNVGHSYGILLLLLMQTCIKGVMECNYSIFEINL